MLYDYDKNLTNIITSVTAPIWPSEIDIWLSDSPSVEYYWGFGVIPCSLMSKGIVYPETAKSHVFLLMQISYPYIVWNPYIVTLIVSGKLCE